MLNWGPVEQLIKVIGMTLSVRHCQGAVLYYVMIHATKFTSKLKETHDEKKSAVFNG